jgi:hypothetical protein
MTAFIPDLDRSKMGSPDRVDALVWALTDLLVEAIPYAGLLEYYRERAIAAGWRPEAWDMPETIGAKVGNGGKKTSSCR